MLFCTPWQLCRISASIRCWHPHLDWVFADPQAGVSPTLRSPRCTDDNFIVTRSRKHGLPITGAGESRWTAKLGACEYDHSSSYASYGPVYFWMTRLHAVYIQLFISGRTKLLFFEPVLVDCQRPRPTATYRMRVERSLRRIHVDVYYQVYNSTTQWRGDLVLARSNVNEGLP